MNALFAVLLTIAAINPIRRRSELPADRRQVGIGAGITLGVLVGLGLGGEALLDALDITIPTFRVAAGLVVVVGALIDLFRPLPAGGPVPAGWAGAVAPVFFPVLFRPVAAVVAVLVGADAAVGWLTVGAALALLDPVFWAERDRSARRDRALGAALSVVAIVLGIDLLVDGIFAL